MEIREQAACFIQDRTRMRQNVSLEILGALEAFWNYERWGMRDAENCLLEDVSVWSLFG